MPDSKIKIEILNLDGVLKFIERHHVAIPEFQRGYVWDQKKVKDFFDSLVKNYPVGSFIIWKTKQDIGERPLLGSVGEKRGKEKYLVLDGQQRMLTLYYLCKQGKFLDAKHFFQEIYENKNKKLIEFEHFYFNKGKHSELKYDAESVQKFDTDEFEKRVGKNYAFPIIIVAVEDYEKAIEIFKRINQSGSKISTEAIFLSEAWNKKTNLGKILRQWRKAGTLSGKLDSIIFIHALAIIVQLENVGGFQTNELGIRLATLKKLANAIKEEKKRTFEKEFKSILKAVTLASSFIVGEAGVTKLSELPSQTLVTVLSIYFYYNSDADKRQRTELKKWFWRSALGGRYIGSGYDDNIVGDAKRMRKLALGHEPLNIKSAELTLEQFLDTDIKSGGSSLSNSVKLMLWKRRPTWISGDLINRDEVEAGTKKKEDDHFYPYHLYRTQILDYSINSILNLIFLPKGRNIAKSKELPSGWLRAKRTELKSSKTDEHKFFESNLLPFKSVEDLVNNEKNLTSSKGKLRKNNLRRHYAKFLEKRFEIFKKELIRLQIGV